jgi:hypothetical protein
MRGILSPASSARAARRPLDDPLAIEPTKQKPRSQHAAHLFAFRWGSVGGLMLTP